MEQDSFSFKKWFGGLAIYFDGKLVSCLMEDAKTKTYKNKKSKFPIWNGTLIPTELVYQQALLDKIPGARQHPVLKKWLYLPATDSHFEDSSQLLTELILKKDFRIGILPNIKRPKKKKSKKPGPKKRTKN